MTPSALPPRASLWAASRRFPWLVVVLLWLLGVVSGVRGLDFGEQWDEHYQMQGVRNSVASLEGMPHRYVYHGIYYDVGYLQLAPIFVKHVPALLAEFSSDPLVLNRKLPAGPAVKALQKELRARVDARGYWLSTRLIFLLLSSLALPWSYLLARSVLPGRPVAAVASTLVVGTSWEFAYHARYIAVDASLAQFTALTLLGASCVFVSRTPHGRLWSVLLAAAGAAGAFSCKITGGVSFVVAGATVLLAPPLSTSSTRAAVQERFAHGSLFVITFALLFFVSTPGFFLDPVRYLMELCFATQKYYQTPSPEYAVVGVPHVMGILRWLFLAAPSPWSAAAVVLSVFAVPGCFVLVRARPVFLFVIVVGVVLHIAVAATSGKLIVRNHLPLFPVMALFIGAGIDGVMRSLWEQGRRRIAAGVCLVLSTVFVGQGAFLIHAAESIRQTSADSIADDVAQDMRAAPDTSFLLTPSVRAQLGPRVSCGPELRLQPVSAAAHVLFRAVEAPAGQWKGNSPGLVEQNYTSLEVNYDWYPRWPGGKHEKARITRIIGTRAAAIGIDLSTTAPCTSP